MLPMFVAESVARFTVIGLVILDSSIVFAPAPPLTVPEMAPAPVNWNKSVPFLPVRFAMLEKLIELSRDPLPVPLMTQVFEAFGPMSVFTPCPRATTAEEPG